MGCSNEWKTDGSGLVFGLHVREGVSFGSGNQAWSTSDVGDLILSPPSRLITVIYTDLPFDKTLNSESCVILKTSITLNLRPQESGE